MPPLLAEASRRLGLNPSGSSSSVCSVDCPEAERAVTSSSCEGEAGAAGAEAPQGPADRPALALFLTLAPPLLFTLGRPDAFLSVLEVRSVAQHGAAQHGTAQHGAAQRSALGPPPLCAVLPWLAF